MLRPYSALAALTAALAWAVIAACGSDAANSAFPPVMAATDDAAPPPIFGGKGDASNGPWSDFPKDPLVDGTPTDAGPSGAAPANAAALFAAGAAAAADAGGSAPCLMEPEVGSLVPKNWLRPRFRWAAAGGANLFEIRVHADNQVNDLLVYTASSQWTMPAAMWDQLRVHSAGVPITLSIRGGQLAGGAVTAVSQGSSGPWGIAPVEAPGSIVYWRIIGDAQADLKGFVIGDDTVRGALTPTKVEQHSTKCVGCHISSPDGKYAILSSNDYAGQYGIGIASIEPATEGKKPPFLTAFGQASLEGYLQGITTVAAPFWTTGKHLVVASSGGQIRWVNLDATTDASSKGAVALTGDAHTQPNSPNLSHDGTKLVYVSGNETVDGRPSGGANDLFTVPFNSGAGGAATPLNGAATTANEYYPSFSPDDKFVAFNRIPSGENPYSAANAEVYIIPSAGGTAQRLAANDPPACTATKSPGVENSWPRWAPAKPAPETVDGKTFYWLVFSSTRFGGGNRQLFMAPVVVDASGTVSAYKAVYLWNQPDNEKNHTPAWDVFAIPPSTPK